MTYDGIFNGGLIEDGMVQALAWFGDAMVHHLFILLLMIYHHHHLI